MGTPAAGWVTWLAVPVGRLAFAARAGARGRPCLVWRRPRRGGSIFFFLAYRPGCPPRLHV